MNKEVILNAGIAAGLVFLGGFSGGEFNLKISLVALTAGLTAFLLRLQQTTQPKSKKAQLKLFKFL